MAELFPPSLDDLIACAEREVRMREQVYPRRVADRRMSQATALRETDLMRAIVDSLRRLKAASPS